MKNNTTLIVGAGPVGLAAALFLQKRNMEVRIIDKLREPSKQSKAFGVNPRTLTLLEPTGATDLFLKNGRKLKAVNIHRHNKCIARNDFTFLNHRFPFMLIQSQADSESIMTDLLLESGIKIERDRELIQLPMNADKVIATIKSGDGKEENIETDLLFAADGAHSAVREILDLDFKGEAFDETWQLYDVELQTPLPKNEAHLFLPDDGVLFLIRLKDNVWRLAGNVNRPFELLPEGTRVGKVIWKSDFKISHRMTETFQKGNILFGGDAAHIHSPLGARGMNLGIEDAFVFSELAAQKRLDHYHRLRSNVVKDVVEKIRWLTNMARGKTAMSKLFHKISPFALPILFPLAKKRFSKFILGIDYDLQGLKYNR